MTSSTERARSKVLLALDGSPAAATACPLARALADQLGAVVEVFHVADRGGPDPDVWQRLHLNLQPGDEVQVRSNVTEPAAATLRATHEPAVEVVVLTTHGRIVQEGRALGRVAQNVVAHTRRPVLLVRPEAAADSEAAVAPLRRLLLPLDGTPTTATALRPATELACRLGAAIDLLYVVSPDQAAVREPGSIGVPRYIDQPHHEWPAWADRVIDHLSSCLGGRPPDVAVQVFLAAGDIGAEIARFALEHQSDAIVLVRRSQLEVGRARVLRAVLDRTPCPVLLVGAG